MSSNRLGKNKAIQSDDEALSVDSEAVTFTIDSPELLNSINQKIQALRKNNWYIRGDKQAWLRDIAASSSLTINGEAFDKDEEYVKLSPFDRNNAASKDPIARDFTKRALFNDNEELYKRHYDNLANNHNQRAATFFKELLFSNVGENHVATVEFNANYRLAEDDNVYLDVNCHDISIIEKNRDLGKASNTASQQLHGTIFFSFLLQREGLQFHSVTFSNSQLAEFCLNQSLDEKRELESEITGAILALQKQLSTSREPEELILSEESEARIHALDSSLTSIDHTIDAIHKTSSEEGEALIKTILTYIKNSLENLVKFKEGRLSLNSFDELLEKAAPYLSRNNLEANLKVFNEAVFLMAQHQLHETLKIAPPELIAATTNLVDKLKAIDSPKDLPKFTNILCHANKLIRKPTESNAKAFKRKTETIRTLPKPWGRMIASAMLILLGATLIGLGIAATVATHGAVLPFFIGGIVACAVLSSAAGVPVGAGITGFFKPRESKPTLKEETTDLLHFLPTPPSDSEMSSPEATSSESDSPSLARSKPSSLT